MKPFIFLVYSFLFVACAQTDTKIENSSIAKKANHLWTFTRSLSQKPRGGVSQGTTVDFDEEASPGWKKLQQKGLSSFEKDRRAILALQGKFKSSFEFLETFSMTPGKKLDQPYASWATEYVQVVEERKKFIALQHIMVMSYLDRKTKKVIGPIVMKHWRQDWTWEPNRMLEFNGDKRWTNKTLARPAARGKWKWDVHQVDDSPRYSGLGVWQHFPSASTFVTEYMARPLPRRERAVRSDYRILMGQDTLVLTPHA